MGGTGVKNAHEHEEIISPGKLEKVFTQNFSCVIETYLSSSIVASIF